MGEQVLARNFAGINSGEWDRCLVAGRNHQLRGAADVALPDQEIEVAVSAHRWIGVGFSSEHRPLYRECRDSLFAEELQQTKKLRRQTKRQEIFCAAALHERLLDLRRDPSSAVTVQASSELPNNAMLPREQQQTLPVDGGQQFEQLFLVAPGRDAFAQGRPLAFERAKVRQCGW